VAIFGAASVLALACGGGDDAESGTSDLISPSAEPMSKARLQAILAQHPEVKNLDPLPALLPKEFMINFVLKHGHEIKGVNGHLVETVVSQSASPSAPRAIVWDERSGFATSFNGGGADQTEPNRLDVLEWDDTAKVFHLSGLQFDGANAPAFQTDAEIQEPNRKCAHCHGNQLRPIFSMYPDWPAFYGSENDELTDKTQPVEVQELSMMTAFKRDIASKQLPRYLPLFDANNVKTFLRGTAIYPSYPYRPDTNTNIEAASRAFAFRPSLRFGVLMNRLMAQATTKRVTDHPSFATFGAFYLHELLECRWSSASALQNSGWLAAVARANGATPKTVAGGTTLHYRDLLKIFGLAVPDVDIRYSISHPGFANDDASDKVMEVGYIDGTYWNSYFDGSATIDELVAMQLYSTLKQTPALKDIDGTITDANGLVEKYSKRVERFKFDQNFFQEMDKKSLWIPIPYPQAKLDSVHHREGFPASFANQHKALCTKLEAHLKSGPSPQ
jgi:hypothetical protein